MISASWQAFLKSLPVIASLLSSGRYSPSLLRTQSSNLTGSLAIVIVTTPQIIVKNEELAGHLLLLPLPFPPAGFL